MGAEQPIRIGIIGAGGIVKQRHLPGFAREADVEVVAVCNRRRETAEAVATEWGIPHVETDPYALIGRADINTVLVGTTPYMHRDLTLAALDAGRHVFCQARMARNVGEARDMLRAAEAHPELVTMLCPPPHVMPGERYVQGLLDAGELGELRLVRLQHLTGYQLSPEAPFHWRMDREVSGYNVLTLGIYNEILNHWLGPARTVAASGKVFTARRPDPETGEPRTVDIPETLGVTGELENGAHYVYTLSAVAACAPGDRIELYGTGGTLIYDVHNQRILVGRPDPSREQRRSQGQAKAEPEEVSIPPGQRGEWRVEADFVSAIRHGTPVSPSFAEGLRYMEFVEAAGRAMEQGRTQRLPLD